jgi:hypothetical protein
MNVLCLRRTILFQLIVTNFIRFAVILGVLTSMFCQMSAGSEPPGGGTRSVEITRIMRPPRIEDFLDFNDAAGAKLGMSTVQGLLQRTPSDGTPVTERTVVHLGYDSKNIYAAFVCSDSHPGLIRARLVNRDQVPDDDDSIALHLDTFNDRKHAYGFQVNPLGVQVDGIYTEGAGWDLSFDTVWSSQGRVTRSGYVVLITVPFKSLRFPSRDMQKWGVFLYRGIPRKNEEAFWPEYSSRVAGRLHQAGVMTGLEKVTPGRNIQFNPYFGFRSSRFLDTRNASNPAFVSDRDLRAGLDSKLIIKNSLVLDATINPDFSQVESDQPQVTVNQRYEVYFPEKRPFFLENASYFDTPINLLFTRRIADPQFGTRLTGKLGVYAVGALFADDQSPGKAVPLGDPEFGKRARFAVVRINRDIGKDSSLGVIYSGRQFDGGSNSVGGVDGRIRFNSNWIANFQAVASSTRLQNGRSLAGPAYEASLLRNGRKLTYNAQFNDFSPGFRTDVGFAPRVDVRQVDQTLSYRFRPEGKHFISWGPSIRSNQIWDHKNTRLEQTFTPKLTWEFIRSTELDVFYTSKQETLRPQDFSTLAKNQSFNEHWQGISLASSFIPQVNFSAELDRGAALNFVPENGRSPYVANYTSATVRASVRPTVALSIENSYLLTRLVDRKSGSGILNDHIVRSKWNYQFTKAMSVRTILQYNSTLSNPAYASVQKTKSLNADFLFTYLLHPGTALYVGYNGTAEDLDRRLIPTQSGFLRTGDKFINGDHQIFVKLSYLMRF